MIGLERVGRLAGIAALVIGAGLTGCDDDVTGPTETPVATMTVDASEAWSFVRLDATPTAVTVTDPENSNAWDLGFFVTGIRVNGGVGGPAGVQTLCLCQNEGATPADYQAMTPESELADFLAVTADDIPSDAAAWSAGSEHEAGIFHTKRWYRYNLAGQHQVWPTYDVYLVRRGSEVYKVQITGYYGPTGDARQISFRSSRISD